MKNLLLILVMPFVFLSCKKDGSKTPDSNNNISINGRWTYIQDSINYYKNGELNHFQVEKYTTDYMQFNSDGTGDVGYTTFTYNLNGSKLILNFSTYNTDTGPNPAVSDTTSVLELSAHKLYILYDFKATGNNTVYSTLSR